MRTRAATSVAITGLILCSNVAFSQGAAPPELPYQTQMREANQAAKAKDYGVARQHYLRALELLHGHPDVVYQLARIEARMGDTESAVAHLQTIAAMGLAYPAATDSVFLGLRGHPDFRRAVARMASNLEPIAHATAFLVLPDTNMIAEDIAYDAVTRGFFVSSVHHGKILSLPDHGRATDFVPAGREGAAGWAIEALAVDQHRRTLWATTSTMPQATGYRTGDSDRTAVLRYDLAAGTLSRRYDLRRDGRAHNLGDMVLDSRGSVIVADGAGGGVYVIRVGVDTLAALVPPGVLRSPQTPAVLPDGRILLSDYALGLAVVDADGAALRWVTHSDTIALNGVDGMALYGHALYAVQNGTLPERVVRFDFDPLFTRITHWTVVERESPALGDPTHGVIVGDSFYFIANSGWDRFTDDGLLKPGPGRPPRVMRLPLTGDAS